MRLTLRMAQNLGLDESFILECIQHNDRYKKFSIRKKDGNKRKILQPSKELKTLQYWLVRNILVYFPISKYSSAYTKGNSVKKNAFVHRNGKYILHTDISEFFPSIKRDMLLALFFQNEEICKKLGLDEDDIGLIADILLYKGRELVIGSVASPMVSNCIMKDFDEELVDKILIPNRFRYTRYADDIIISSMKYIDEEIIEKVDNLMESKGFKRNIEKTYYMNKKCKRKITGIVLDNNENRLSLGHRNYRKLKKDIYNLLVKNKGEITRIKGYLAFVKDIDSEKYETIVNVYKRYDKRNILF